MKSFQDTHYYEIKRAKENEKEKEEKNKKF